MTRRWVQEHQRDAYRKQAMRENYRSRASFKLKQINTKHHVMRRGDVVLDLGASPGGWSQVAVELVGKEGMVIGVDLQQIQPMEGCIFIRGDITVPQTLERIVGELEKAGKERITVVISDMSTNISGSYDMDQARSAHLASTALSTAERLLKRGGNFVCKIFQGSDTEEFISDVQSMFRSVRRYSPPASRKSSSEIYIIGKARK